MESYIVRIYREEKKNPRNLIGIVEEVGVEEKKAFTNLDELWNILNSIKKEPKQPKKEILFKSETEKRNEVRIKKEIPFVFFHNERKLKARTVDFCKNGLCLKIPERTPLTVGDIVNLKVKDFNMKAEVRWVDNKSNPSMTLAGFKIVDGKLNLKGCKKGGMPRDESGSSEASPNWKI